MTPQARIGTSSDDTMRFRRVERVFLVIGLLFLDFWAAARLDSGIISRAAIARFRADQPTDPIDRSALPDPDSNSAIDFRLWSVQRISAYQESLTQGINTPVAVLRIPKIALEVPVFNDTSDLTLNRGVGRILGTARIGQPGNLGIAGHRDGFFRPLQNMTAGDVIELDRPGHTDTYVVSEIRIVAPEDTSVLAQTATPTLTLVTCYPFYFIGHAPQRYIVTASVETTHESDSSAHERSISTGKKHQNEEEIE